MKTLEEMMTGQMPEGIELQRIHGRLPESFGRKRDG